jgi:hypothetical protein
MKIYRLSAPIPFEEEVKKKDARDLRNHHLNDHIDDNLKSEIEGILSGLGYNKLLGFGYYGVAYKLGDGKVAKITRSQVEFDNAVVVKRGEVKSDRLAKIYAAEKISDNVYLIITDQFTPLKDSYKIKTFNSLYSIVFKNAKTIVDIDFDKFILLIKNKQIASDLEFYDSCTKYLTRDYEMLFEFYSFFQEITKIGFHLDSHHENVGYNNKGKLILFDLGT